MARCKLSARKQCPYEATTTRLNSHGSEERTQEDTMNHCERSPSPSSPEYGLSELYVGRSGGGCHFVNRLSLLTNFSRPTTCRYHIPHVVAYVVPDVEGASQGWKTTYQYVSSRAVCRPARSPARRYVGQFHQAAFERLFFVPPSCLRCLKLCRCRRSRCTATRAATVFLPVRPCARP
jgi:hypothetical protein